MMFDYFWSDPHFGHKNIIKHCNRPFEDVTHMNRELIRNYNSVVNPEDHVLWVGDAFFCGVQEAKTIMSYLNGKKSLVLGNHDRSSAKMVEMGFEMVTKQVMISIAGTPVRISHYPYYGDSGDHEERYTERRPPMNDSEILIHGHTHSKEQLKDRMIHVGVDAWDYTPVYCGRLYSLVPKAKAAKHRGQNGKNRMETSG